jgi:hypothetical protein
MTLSKKLFGVAIIAALGTLLVSAQLSSATHPRPKGASPFLVSIVVAYKNCTAPTSTHGAPLAVPSCVPPTQDSNFLTVGTPDANGAPANNVAAVKLVVDGVPPEDVLITSNATDVRCRPATSATVCNSANAADGPDYSGQVQGTAQIRITDHYNGASGTDTGTATDLPFPVNTNCANTAANTATGGTCNVSTTANTVVPGSVQDTKRGNVEVQTLQIMDGGANGVAGAPGATRFGTQGIFIP